ncbi:hypothetical protein [Wolbachia endosymbiont of Aedes aegypti]|uniref:hypothetical protein n=1 Tax=Wolbachia endosymbiont of Aedes aegypti TaxID=546165 RepID=UPI001FD9CC25|nr:hypothetical protein [Wolbachia endosymbiont of Aedes aegypti]
MESQFFNSKRRSKIRSGVNVIRYADDFIISGITREVLENELKPLVSSFLQGERSYPFRKKKKITSITTF